MHTFGMHSGERIKKARDAAKLSQEKLGDICGVTRNAVSLWETNDEERRTYPDSSRWGLISAATGFCVEWLMYGTGPERPGVTKFVTLTPIEKAMVDAYRQAARRELPKNGASDTGMIGDTTLEMIKSTPGLRVERRMHERRQGAAPIAIERRRRERRQKKEGA